MTGILNALIAGVSGAVKDTYFNLVSLLLPGNGTNGATNNSFVDSSTANSGTGWPITRNGDTTQGTFSPFSQTGWSNYYNGSGYFSSSTALFAYTTGNASTQTFTIEAMVYHTARTTPVFQPYSQCIAGKGNVYMNFGINGTGNLIFLHNDGTERIITSSSTVPLNSWTYVAIVVSGGTATMYINNSSVGSGTWYGIAAGAVSSTSYFGKAATAPDANVFQGYISNLRVSSTARTAAVPTSGYTNDGNTVFLFNSSNQFVDKSSNAYPITVVSTPSVTPFSPFAPTSSYTAAAVGGSGYFDGANDYLDAGNQTALHLGSGNFTIEMWLWKNANTAYMIPCGDFNGGGTNTFQIIGDATGTKIAWYNGASSSFALTSSSSLPINTWNHIAFVRNSGTLSLYINGSSDGTPVSLGTDYNATTSFIIGNTTELSAGRWWFGYISNLRIVKGTAVYTGNFTPPTKPLATSGADSAGSYPSTNNINTSFAGSATSLLLNFTNAGVVDATAKNVLETEGNAQISTAQSKWGGGSIYFDGTGDWLTVPKAGNWSIGSSEPFTIEAWVYLTAAQANYRALLSDYNSGSPGSSKYLFINSSGIEFQLGTTAGTVASCTQSFSQNQWYYIAITRNSSNVISMYVDGVSKTVSQATQSGAFLDVGSIFYVGRWGGTTAYEWYGYIDDLRITKGVARTITASPSAPFPLQ